MDQHSQIIYILPSTILLCFKGYFATETKNQTGSYFGEVLDTITIVKIYIMTVDAIFDKRGELLRYRLEVVVHILGDG